MPDTVQMLAALLVVKVNDVSPLDAVAVRVTGATPSTTGVAGAKLMVWLAKLIVTMAFVDALA